MKKNPMALLGISLLVIGLVFTHLHHAKADASPVQNGTIQIGQHTTAEFPTLAKITLDLAISNALKAVPGHVIQTELENENGFLVYGIEIAATDKTIVDVKVDAGSGQILAKDHHESHEKNHEHDEQDENEDSKD